MMQLKYRVVFVPIFINVNRKSYFLCKIGEHQIFYKSTLRPFIMILQRLGSHKYRE